MNIKSLTKSVAVLCFSVCPDPVDKYLEETSVRYVSPRGGESREAAPHRRTGECVTLHVYIYIQYACVCGGCNKVGGNSEMNTSLNILAFLSLLH